MGSVGIGCHSIFAFVGMVIGGGLSIRLSRYLVNDARVYPFAIAVIVGGLLAARAAHVADNWASYGGDVVKMISFSCGGIAKFGASIGATITGTIAVRWIMLPIGFTFGITVL